MMNRTSERQLDFPDSPSTTLPLGVHFLHPIENRFTDSLPGDPDTANQVREVPNACYSRVRPTQVQEPQLVAVSQGLLGDLGISRDDSLSEEFLEIMSGNRVLDAMEPYAACYGGHQFGAWAGQLGDGRAITLCETRTTDGNRVSLQLKGAGPTPYARSADGLAVLRSSLREFVCSEAMHYLNVPTTRALSLVLTGESVVRDFLYDGHPAPEPGAVVCRVAPSFIRFGNFQIHAARKEWDLLKQLADYTIREHFPNVAASETASCYVDWYWEVCRRTASLVCEWMRLGFVHGVMNTDNMSILGETIDYGPYGWLDVYDPNWTPNTTDASTLRYAYGRQPAVAQWNLLQLANAIVPLVKETSPLEEAINAFPQIYGELWKDCLCKKLGLGSWQAGDDALVQEMDKVLCSTETDFTIFFRQLAYLTPCDGSHPDDPLNQMAAAFYQPDTMTEDVRRRVASWLRKYVRRVSFGGNSSLPLRISKMEASNPLFVPRNFIGQLAIDRVAEGDFSYLQKWMKVLRRPYSTQSADAEFYGKRPEWARNRLGCSMLSCSS